MTDRNRLQKRAAAMRSGGAPREAVAAVALRVAVTLLAAFLCVVALTGCGGTPTANTGTANTGTAGSGTAGSGTAGTGTSDAITVDGATGGEEADRPPGAAGTRRDPIPLGSAAQVGDWKVRVTGAMLDATQAVLDENMFNKPPAEGSRYVLVAIQGTYVGDESSTFWIDIDCTFVGDEGDAYDVASAVAPDSVLKLGETVAGGEVTGNLVFLVPSGQAAGATLMIEEMFARNLARVFFALE